MKTQKIITLILILALFTFLMDIENRVSIIVDQAITSIKNFESFDFDLSDLNLTDRFKTVRSINIYELFNK